jgi:hypothetical protein
MADKVKEYEATNEFVAVKVMEIEVSQASLRSALVDAPRLKAKLVGQEEGPVLTTAGVDVLDVVTGELLPVGLGCWWVPGVGHFRDQPTEIVIAHAKQKAKKGGDGTAE